MNPLEYYEKAVCKTQNHVGDYIKIYWKDGRTNEGMVEGIMLASGVFFEVHVLLTKGPRLRLTVRDNIEIIKAAF